MSPFGRGSGGGEESTSRTEEERERARQERAARRASRTGTTADNPALDIPSPLPDTPTPPVAATPPAAPEPEPPPPDPPPPEPPPPPPPDVFPPVSEDRLARLPAASGDVAIAPVAATTESGPVIPSTEPPIEDDERDHPIGPRSAAAAPKPTGVLGAAAARGPRRRHNGRRWILLIALLGVVGAVAWFANSLWQPFHGSGHGRVVVDIPPNSSSQKIGDLLAQKGAVDSGFFFALRARLSGDSGKLRPGHYVLQEDMPYSAAITALSTVPKAAKVTNVSLPEGLSIHEAGPRVKAAGLRGSYVTDTARSDELKPRFYGAPKDTHSLEGFLFPATYQVKTGASVNSLIHKQVVAFRKALKQVDMSYARSKHLTVYDVLTIASMVERESASAADRKKIAAVIYNRLHQHIPLGVDATLRFALRDWNKPLTVSQLRTDTPYNTRIHVGLPPTPIGSPGLGAMNAAAHPAKVSYLYYVANPDGCGGTLFSSTDAKFERDVARYKAAVANNNGHVPSCKHTK